MIIKFLDLVIWFIIEYNIIIHSFSFIDQFKKNQKHLERKSINIYYNAKIKNLSEKKDWKLKTCDTIKFLFNFKQCIYDSCFSIHQIWQLQTSVVITIYQNSTRFVYRRWSNEFRHGWRVERSHIPIAIIDLNNDKDTHVCTRKNSRWIVKLRNPINPIQAVLNIESYIYVLKNYLKL